jgi:2-hydroxy-6-oxonona-2,4-dienedioate hydrolase
MDELRYREAEQRLFAHEGVTPAERRVHLERLDVDVRVQEVGDGEPTLFVHGGPNSGTTWLQLAARVSGLRCLLLDRPGTGLSGALPDPVRPHNLRAYAETLVVDVLDALEVERAHLVVSSFGGLIALYTAAAHPDRVDRMVQMACPAMAPGGATPPFLRLIMTPVVGRLIGMLPPTPRAARAILRQIGHGASLDTGRIPDEFIDWYVALQRHTDTLANESAMIQSAGGPRGFDPALELPADVFARVTAPTYWLWGEDDEFGGRDVAERLAAAMPDAQLEMLPSAGHLPWLDDPDHAAQVVTAHLLGRHHRGPEQEGGVPTTRQARRPAR